MNRNRLITQVLDGVILWLNATQIIFLLATLLVLFPQ